MDTLILVGFNLSCHKPFVIDQLCQWVQAVCHNANHETKHINQRYPKLLGMVLATDASGLVMGFGAGYLLAALMRNQSSGWGDLTGAIIGLLFFYPVGVVLG